MNFRRNIDVASCLRHIHQTIISVKILIRQNDFINRYIYTKKNIPQSDFAYLYTVTILFHLTRSWIWVHTRRWTKKKKNMLENLRYRIILLLCAGEWLVVFFVGSWLCFLSKQKTHILYIHQPTYMFYVVLYRDCICIVRRLYYIYKMSL